MAAARHNRPFVMIYGGQYTQYQVWQCLIITRFNQKRLFQAHEERDQHQ